MDFLFPILLTTIIAWLSVTTYYMRHLEKKLEKLEKSGK